MTKPRPSATVTATTAIRHATLPQVRGGAYEGYLEIGFEKQGKNKGTTPR